MQTTKALMKERWYFFLQCCFGAFVVFKCFTTIRNLHELSINKDKHAITTLRNLANFANFFAGMSLKKSGGPFKFPGRFNFTHRTAQTTFVRVVTPRNKLILPKLLCPVLLTGIDLCCLKAIFLKQPT